MMMPTFLRRSGWLVGFTVVATTVGFVSLAWVNGRLTAMTAALTARQRDTARAALAQSFGSDEQRELLATVPTEPQLISVYGSLESLAARHGVELRYNFSSEVEQDPTLVQAEAAKESWVIPVDFLGSQSALEEIFTELETGPYFLKLHRYRFDVTDPDESLLSTTLVLYGR